MFLCTGAHAGKASPDLSSEERRLLQMNGIDVLNLPLIEVPWQHLITKTYKSHFHEKQVVELWDMFIETGWYVSNRYVACISSLYVGEREICCGVKS